MAEAFWVYLNIEPSMKRVDSVMVASHDPSGNVGNIVETFDDQGATITGYDYDINSHSDS